MLLMYHLKNRELFTTLIEVIPVNLIKIHRYKLNSTGKAQGAGWMPVVL